MIIRVCSGFSPDGHRQYGDRFMRSFDRYWPQDVELQIYVEQPTRMPRGAYRDLWSIPGAQEFHVKHSVDPMASGRAVRAGWKDKDRRDGYCFKFDAVKFWKQILIPQAASDGLDEGDILIWLDADVETFRPISKVDLLDLIPGNAQVSYLGRAPKHSEIGFWAVRMDGQVASFLAEMALLYTTDEVFELPEWHSAFVWDTARRAAGLREHNLCPPGARGHVWPTTRLAQWTRHDKGARKPR